VALPKGLENARIPAADVMAAVEALETANA
jgi:hypothetical protein